MAPFAPRVHPDLPWSGDLAREIDGLLAKLRAESTTSQAMISAGEGDLRGLLKGLSDDGHTRAILAFAAGYPLAEVIDALRQSALAYDRYLRNVLQQLTTAGRVSESAGPFMPDAALHSRSLSIALILGEDGLIRQLAETPPEAVTNPNVRYGTEFALVLQATQHLGLGRRESAFRTMEEARAAKGEAPWADLHCGLKGRKAAPFAHLTAVRDHPLGAIASGDTDAFRESMTFLGRSWDLWARSELKRGRIALTYLAGMTSFDLSATTFAALGERFGIALPAPPRAVAVDLLAAGHRP